MKSWGRAERKKSHNEQVFQQKNFPTIAQLACATHADEWAVGDFKSGVGQFGQQQRRKRGNVGMGRRPVWSKGSALVR